MTSSGGLDTADPTAGGCPAIAGLPEISISISPENPHEPAQRALLSPLVVHPGRRHRAGRDHGPARLAGAPAGGPAGDHRHHPVPTTVTSPTTTTPPASIEPTSKPTAPLWQESGSGTETSPGFQAPATWRIEWSFDCSNFKRLGGGNFKITGTGAFGRVDIQELDVKASGTRTFTRGGFGHLLVDSVCKRWSVRALPG